MAHRPTPHFGSGGRDGQGYALPAYIVPVRHLRLALPANDNKAPLSTRLRRAVIAAGVIGGIGATLLSLLVM